MKLVVVTVSDGAPDVLSAHLAFHLNAGADLVLIARTGLSEEAAGSVETYLRDGSALVVDAVTHTELARVAAVDHAADWVIPSRDDEFWWPRGESLKDVLSVVPARYSLVHGLLRTFAGARVFGEPFFEQMTVRSSFLGPRGSDGADPQELLRPAYRAAPDLVVDLHDRTLSGRLVPLRAWYPIEVLWFPAAAVIAPGTVDAGLAEGRLAVDNRLRDALRSIHESGSMDFPIPGIVDDASHAIECAAVGEVDLEALDRQIRQLELRLAALEARFWPRVHRAVRRLARRPS